ncbi:hypothetical protein DMC25_05435 [Caulobacter sp. D4A]|uniref:hypothetical protein n=1 Tax=unclassified Caulobacter TaxID=2648921 RepID=UPI000D73B35A|nr:MULTISPECIES: hypothetical protein [unclassified Caulobacter]PXA91879.1 hypothetical protein DMC25_05435 [Caulobacter sp. D4A]PXA92069.1 hypothetical protein DMC18_11925 [Caulobacter sp. D5]
MKTKFAYLAAAATLSLAGAAYAQSTAQDTNTTAPADPAAAAQPPSSTTSTTSTTTTTTPPADTSAAAGADAAGTPSSATVSGDFKVGSEIKDPSGAVVGTISDTATGADGSANVVVSSGEKKFALPKASLSAGADGSISTTATKAQIDAALAGAAAPK